MGQECKRLHQGTIQQQNLQGSASHSSPVHSTHIKNTPISHIKTKLYHCLPRWPCIRKSHGHLLPRVNASTSTNDVETGHVVHARSSRPVLSRIAWAKDGKREEQGSERGGGEEERRKKKRKTKQKASHPATHQPAPLSPQSIPSLSFPFPFPRHDDAHAQAQNPADGTNPKRQIC